MMESSRVVVITMILVATIVRGSSADTRYYVKMRTNSTNPFKYTGLESARSERTNRTISDGSTRSSSSQDAKTRSGFRIDDETMIRESLKANQERRNSFVESSTFDPDVLNKFLDDYANKIKTTTPKSYDFPFRVDKPVSQSVIDVENDGGKIFEIENDSGANKTMEQAVNSTLETSELNSQDLNDTLKRNKYFGGNANDDRNGWVTLDAIPWSKSKISKWQANPSSQRPWPEIKNWDKPSSVKPWGSDFPSRPSFPNNEPWYDTQKPYRPDYQKDRPSSSPSSSTRPSSYFSDRFDDNNPSQAQKWPPERPLSSWEKFPSSDSYRPNTDIITDDRPSNFPNSWDKYGQTSSKPAHSYNDNRDRFTNNNNNNNNNNYNQNNKQQQQQQQHQPHDWRDHENDYPSKFDLMKDEKPTIYWGPNNDKGHHQSSNRPSSSHYHYTPEHPPNHPSTGDGQWVLLSTNHGYSKSRQRSIKFDAINGDSTIVRKLLNVTAPTKATKQDNDGTVAVMTSRRQVRLTVLPSINGTNTTTSHGGLLEVERTFKTVDQSQKEYEDGKIVNAEKPILLKKRPMRQTPIARPSNAAVLAAVGAGMLPATMAMMIPIMLGRKKRSISTIFADSTIDDFYHRRSYDLRGNDADEKNTFLRLYKTM